MSDRSWIAALTGLAFMVLAIAGSVIMGDPPDPKDESLQEIVNFYKDNDTEIWIATLIQGAAATLLVFYGGFLRKVLRRAEGEGHMLSAVVLAGATIVAVGAALDATINIALVEEIDDIQPVAAQALSALWSNDWIVLLVGMQVFMLAAGLSIVRHGALPKWLGWVAILLGLVGMTPAGFVGFIGTGVWIVVTSILLAVRERRASAAPPAEASSAPA
jgi:hypothetical protein